MVFSVLAKGNITMAYYISSIKISGIVLVYISGKCLAMFCYL